jgi:hypothetical protein
MNISSETQKQINELSNIDNRILIESQINNNNEVLIAITINKSLIKFEKEPLDIIRFILQIKSTYPETPPLLFCISRFCIPELCDGRDFLEDTLQMKWDKNNCFLKLIISQIPSFVQRYLNYINGNNVINNIILRRKMFGKYYLDSIYETSIIKYIPYLYFNNISEVVSIEGKKMLLEDRKMLITDNFLLLFCPKNLYEIDKLKLVFVGPITSLLYIRQFYKDGIVLLKWIIKGKGLQNSNFTMQFKTQDGDYIVDTLIDNLSKRSINFKVTNTINGNIKREGTVPMVEINLVEEEIKNLEKKINNKENITKESISILINLYEKAIQYYSALNNKRFEIFIKKIHEVYSNTEYTSLLNMKTVSNANNQYNVTQFKRKRKKRNIGDEGTNKKKKEKKIKNKTEINNENVLDIKDNNNAEKEKKESENNIDNENINNNKNENKDEPKEEIIKEENNNKINKDDKIKPEINTTKKSDEIEKEEKKEVKNETKKRPKRNLKKKEEKQKEEKEKINSMEKEISQRMILDKKEIEEMLKNEINIGNENKEKNINDKEKDDIKSDDKREENM